MERHSKERVPDISIYTDGSLKQVGAKLTFGGWAFLVIKDDKCVYGSSGGENNTTNQRMELLAVIEALKYAAAKRRPHERVTIYSDSAYFVNCYNQDWYIKWQANGWQNANRKPVANADLWQQIIPYFDNFWYSFKKVPAHSGLFWNEYCDKLAQEHADKMKRDWRGTNNDR